jgi:hypothetical protein
MNYVLEKIGKMHVFTWNIGQFDIYMYTIVKSLYISSKDMHFFLSFHVHNPFLTYKYQITNTPVGLLLLPDKNSPQVSLLEIFRGNSKCLFFILKYPAVPLPTFRGTLCCKLIGLERYMDLPHHRTHKRCWRHSCFVHTKDGFLMRDQRCSQCESLSVAVGVMPRLTRFENRGSIFLKKVPTNIKTACALTHRKPI